MTWAAIGSTAISVGGQLAAGGGGSQNPGVQVITKPQFDFSEPGLREQSRFLRDQLASLGRGEFPQFFQNLIPQLRQELETPLLRRTFGDPGRRSQSQLGLAQSAAALSGFGGRGLTQQGGSVDRALTDFQNRSQSIDRFIAQQGADIAGKFSLAVPELLQRSPKGPDSEIVSFGGGGGGGGSIFDTLASGFGQFAGAGGLDKIGSFFGNKTPALVSGSQGRLTGSGAGFNLGQGFGGGVGGIAPKPIFDTGAGGGTFFQNPSITAGRTNDRLFSSGGGLSGALRQTGGL